MKERHHARHTESNRLPSTPRPLFWDHDFARLRWNTDRDLVIGRVLASGPWNAVRWLRARLPNPELRAWLQQRQGAGLSNRQLRFWDPRSDRRCRGAEKMLSAKPPRTAKSTQRKGR